MDGETAQAQRLLHVWQAGRVVFDERTQELRVGNAKCALEAIPLQIFLRLLQGQNGLVGKDELRRAGWGNGDASDQSLQTAISKLRKAFGHGEQDLIEVRTGRGGGYRLTKPITRTLSTPPSKPLFSFSAGDAVPRKQQWRLKTRLASAEANDVWLAVQRSTAERRVFKFADTPERIEALKREMALSRLLREALGPATGFVSILDGDFEGTIAYIESEYGGLDLVAWADSHGGLQAIPLSTRLAVLADAASALAAAHGVGVLHGDLKPGNVLIETAGDGAPNVRLADFGAGGLTEAARSKALNTSLQMLAAKNPRQPGTTLYLPPEPLADGRPTMAADMYALGILLYHLVIGAFGRSLTPQWDRNVSDPLLRQDIADASADAPLERLASASELAVRLRTLDDRRARCQADADRARTELQLREESLARQRRRPFVIAAAGAVIMGLGFASFFAVQVRHERDEVMQQSEMTGAVDQFLTEDLLGRGNPAISGKPNETLMEAAEAAEPMIEQRLANQPRLAASIYIMLTRAFDSRGAFDASRKAYERADAILTKLNGSSSAEVTILRLRRADMELVSGLHGSLEKAKALIADSQPKVDALGDRRKEARAWLLCAEGRLETVTGDLRKASANFANAARIAESMPGSFDAHTQFEMREEEGFNLMKLGRYEEAGQIFSRLLAEQILAHGPLHPDTLIVAMNQAELPFFSGHPDVAAPLLAALIPKLRNIFGPSNKRTFTALGVEAENFQRLGRYDDAERDALEIYRNALATEGADSWWAFSELDLAGTSECRNNRAEEGIKKVREAVATSARVLGASHPVTLSGEPDIALCLLKLNRPAEAREAIAGFDCGKLAALTGQPEICAVLGIEDAAIALQLGDRKSASVLLNKSLPRFGHDPEDSYFRDWGRSLVAQLQTEK